VSRSAIWKAVAALKQLGMLVRAVPNRGYCLPRASVPLDAQAIAASLPPAVAARLRRGQTLWSTDSTNAQLLARTGLQPGEFDFLAAEYQTSGRGRRTRSWFAPPGGSLCLSVAWSFPALPSDAGALSLAIGVCALRALAANDVRAATLKWPNDLVTADGKLGGILIELRAESAGPAYVVIGIGLNVVLGEPLLERVRASGTQPIDLAALGIEHCDRNRLAATLIAESVAGLERFELDGFAPFAAEWRRADALAGKAIVVSGGDGGRIAGHARGIDRSGALCVQTREGLQRFVCGDVSVRAGA
jgi:BirA family biotin operon repressor/biotin-[acetyl-CoA-carboxylase] ligase